MNQVLNEEPDLETLEDLEDISLPGSLVMDDTATEPLDEPLLDEAPTATAHGASALPEVAAARDAFEAAFSALTGRIRSLEAEVERLREENETYHDRLEALKSVKRQLEDALG